MRSGHSTETTLREQVREYAKVVKGKHISHPEANDMQNLQEARQEVRKLREMVLQMAEIMKAQHAKVLGLMPLLVGV